MRPGDDGAWITDSPMGEVTVRFAPANAFEADAAAVRADPERLTGILEGFAG